MTNNDELLSQFRAQAGEIDQLMHDDLRCIDSPLLKQVVDYAIFNGGKRLRPLLSVLFAQACTAPGEPHVKFPRFAIAFEYLHAASLLHDDVIDHASLRRGKVSANERWGNHMVILAGDFLHSRALYLAGVQGGIHCIERVCQAVQGMVEGEYLQLENESDTNPSEAYYFKVLEGKTAMLIRAACESGPLFVGAPTAQCEAARAYGQNLGLAYQVTDDLLDYLGSRDKMGKEQGCDWREKRMTLPLIYALENCGATDRAWLLEAFNDDTEARIAALERVTALLHECGAFERARQMAQTLVAAAVEALEHFPSSEATLQLRGLAHYVLTREK